MVWCFGHEVKVAVWLHGVMSVSKPDSSKSSAQHFQSLVDVNQWIRSYCCLFGEQRTVCARAWVLLLNNYLGSWVLGHVLFGQWNIFRPHPLSHTRPPSKNIHIGSHFLPQRAASETITDDAMQAMGGGNRREGFLCSPWPAARLVLPQLLLSLLCFYPGINTLSGPHSSVTSCNP